jgi:NTE family protein
MNTASTRRTWLTGLSAMSAVLASGSSALAQTASKPKNTAPQQNSNASPKLAIVLGSGAARGFAHIGVIKAFDAAGIKPSIIVGTSAGSLVGSLWAAGFTGAQIEDIALKVKDADIIDLASLSKRGLVSGDQIEQLVNQLVKNRKIEQLPIKFASVATIMRTGELAIMQEGDLGFAVRASCSIPGVFLPAKKNEIEYIDGGLVSPMAVKVARQLGADVVVAVDVNSSAISVTPQGIFEQIMHSFDIMGRALSRLESEQADIMVKPEMSRIAGTDFGSRTNSIQLGFFAGQRMAPVIIEKMAQLNNKRTRSK